MPKQNREQNRGTHSSVAKLCVSSMLVSENLRLDVFHPHKSCIASPALLGWIHPPSCLYSVEMFLGQQSTYCSLINMFGLHLTRSKLFQPRLVSLVWTIPPAPCFAMWMANSHNACPPSQRGGFQGRAKQEGTLGWPTFIVNLTGFWATQTSHLWARLWGYSQGELTEVETHPAHMRTAPSHGPGSWAETGESKLQHTSNPLPPLPGHELLAPAPAVKPSLPWWTVLSN